MKRFEQMAQQGAAMMRGPQGEKPSFDEYQAFLKGYEAGFKAAREIAAIRAQDMVDDGWFEVEPEIMKLGEGEVQ